ncbi:CBS domain-containing protein [Streptomyces prasinus]|uniref:CBS domain-containing protein n=1 Tax=Streptomyces prasinus TaxID=67345 RepID=UPI00099E75B5|nr:CBS domain-containing protein [Streptomyces prasinus]
MAQRVGDVMTRAPATVEPLTSVTVVARAVEGVREHAVRRTPVVDDGRHAVGIVSPADPAVERDPGSALGAVSAARPDQ